MPCMQLIEDKGSVRECKHPVTYLVIRRTDGEVIETLCTAHAEKMIKRNLIEYALYQMRYCGKQLLTMQQIRRGYIRRNDKADEYLFASGCK